MWKVKHMFGYKDLIIELRY